MTGRICVLACLLAVAMPTWAEPVLYGRYEQVRLPELGKTLRAKLDTGALTASLSARDIERFERDGEQWVRFRLATKGADNTLYEHRLARISTIKSRSEESRDDDDERESKAVAKRPVIELELCLGQQVRKVEVNLTDRSRFNYPLLVGASALRELQAAVDPARQFTAGKPGC